MILNIVSVVKKNDSLRVCIDFRDLNSATPKDQYHVPMANMLIDLASVNEILSLMDGYPDYNQIYIAEEDIHKIVFRCPGAIGIRMGNDSFRIKKCWCHIPKSHKSNFS